MPGRYMSRFQRSRAGGVASCGWRSRLAGLGGSFGRRSRCAAFLHALHLAEYLSILCNGKSVIGFGSKHWTHVLCSIIRPLLGVEEVASSASPILPKSCSPYLLDQSASSKSTDPPLLRHTESPKMPRTRVACLWADKSGRWLHLAELFQLVAMSSFGPLVGQLALSGAALYFWLSVARSTYRIL